MFSWNQNVVQGNFYALRPSSSKLLRRQRIPRKPLRHYCFPRLAAAFMELLDNVDAPSIIPTVKRAPSNNRPVNSCVAFLLTGKKFERVTLVIAGQKEP